MFKSLFTINLAQFWKSKLQNVIKYLLEHSYETFFMVPTVAGKSSFHKVALLFGLRKCQNKCQFDCEYNFPMIN